MKNKKDKVIDNFKRLQARKHKKPLKFRKFKPMLRLIKRDMIETFRNNFKTDVESDPENKTMTITVNVPDSVANIEIASVLREYEERINETK